MRIAILLWVVVMPFCMCYGQGKADNYRQALRLYLRQHYDKALIFADKAVSDNPRDTEAFNLRGMAYYKLKLYRQAVSNFDTTLQLDPGYRKNYFFRANAKYLLQDYAGALADFQMQLKLFPGDANNYTNVADAKYRVDDFQGALADVNKAISMKPRYKFGYMIRGSIEVSLGRYQDALADLNKAIDMGGNRETYLARARARYKLGDISGACLDLGISAESDSDREKQIEAVGPRRWLEADDYENKALAAALLGDFKGALEASEKALTLDSTRVRAHNLRGRARLGLEDYNGALQDLNFVLDATPENVQSLYNRAVVKFKLQDKAGGCVDYQLSLKFGAKPDDRMAEYCK